MEIKEIATHGKRKIFVHGFADYDGLSAEQKYRLLFPLAKVIHKYYQDSANREKFEKWKAEYLKQNPATPQDFFIDFVYSFAIYLIRSI